jgi:hypothetical protein
MFATTLRYPRMIRRGIGRGGLCCLGGVVAALAVGNPAPASAKGHGGPTPTCAHNTCRKMPSPAKAPAWRGRRPPGYRAFRSRSEVRILRRPSLDVAARNDERPAAQIRSLTAMGPGCGHHGHRLLGLLSGGGTG